MKQYLFTDPFDPSWIEKYKASMGESGFNDYANKLWRHLLNIKVGEVITISDWCKPKNYDLFYKIAQCFIMESKGAYLFRNNYTEIKHYYDAGEMETEAALYRAKYKQKNIAGNGGGIECGERRTEAVPASPPKV